MTRLLPEVFLFVLVVVGVGAHLACTPTEKAIAKTALDLSNAVCEQIPVQDEPDYIKFSCSLVAGADGVSHIFLAKVKKEDASVFAARNCKPKGGVFAP